ncbi:MAG: NTP transferase domain-containing protein [Bacteroidaceae bacterium]|nr:NTP transferase domain-containing protein [Bacteroidaceae bacterium]
MNVFILAAGLGTRLKPLTNTMPKALVRVGGKPLLQHLLDKLNRQCNGEPLNIVVNVHHFGEQIIDYLKDTDIRISDERSQLLDTGGALRQALPMFFSMQDAGCRMQDSVLVHNVDIFSNENLHDFYHEASADEEAMVVMLVSERQTSRYLLFDDANRLVGWTNIQTGEVKSPYSDLNVEACHRYAFSGIQVVKSSLMPYLERQTEPKFSVIDFYLSICHEVCIRAAVRPSLQLLDVGKMDALESAEAVSGKLVEG